MKVERKKIKLLIDDAERDIVYISIKGRIFLYNEEKEIFEDFEEFFLKKLQKNRKIIE